MWPIAFVGFRPLGQTFHTILDTVATEYAEGVIQVAPAALL